MSDSPRPPPAYRAYVMEPDGGIANVYELVCDTDEQAIRAALTHVDGHPIELWDKRRKIAVLPPVEPLDLPAEQTSPVMNPVDAERCDVLTRSFVVRTQEGFRLSWMAKESDRQGEPEVADALRETADHNEMERLKVRAQIEALDN